MIPDVSIVIANHNGSKYLKQTIPHILKWHGEKEIIVADNASTDDSVQYLDSFTEIRVIKNTTISKTIGQNFAAKKSTGKYLLLLDNDIIIDDENILKELVNFYESLDRPGFVGISFHNQGEEDIMYGGFFNYKWDRSRVLIHPSKIDMLHGRQIGFAFGASLFIKRQNWEKLKGYDETYPFGAPDSDVCARAWLFGMKNYAYTKSMGVHIGISERTQNDKYIRKYPYLIASQQLGNILKNYSLHNAIIALPYSLMFSILKTVKQCIERKDIRVLWAFCKGIWLFLKNLPETLAFRSFVQKHRTEKRDAFLFIKPQHE